MYFVHAHSFSHSKKLSLNCYKSNLPRKTSRGLWTGLICMSFNSSTSCLPTSTFIRIVFPSQFPSARRSLSFCQLYPSPEALLSEELFLAWLMEGWLLSLSALASTSFAFAFHVACGFFLWHFTNTSKICFLSTQIRYFRKGVQ